MNLDRTLHGFARAALLASALGILASAQALPSRRLDPGSPLVAPCHDGCFRIPGGPIDSTASDQSPPSAGIETASSSTWVARPFHPVFDETEAVAGTEP